MNSFEVFGWFPVIGDYNLSSPGEPTHIAAVEVSPALLAATGAAPIARGVSSMNRMAPTSQLSQSACFNGSVLTSSAGPSH
jgi:hypothetical protein